MSDDKKILNNKRKRLPAAHPEEGTGETQDIKKVARIDERNDKDFKEAVEGYEKDFARGKKAQEMLLESAGQLLSGDDVTQDIKEAVRLYTLLARTKGNLAEDSQYSLAECFSRGEGVPKDGKKALLLYKRLAEKGYEKAQFKLGTIFEKNQIYPQAFRFYHMAGSQERGKTTPERQQAIQKVNQILIPVFVAIFTTIGLKFQKFLLMTAISILLQRNKLNQFSKDDKEEHKSSGPPPRR